MTTKWQIKVYPHTVSNGTVVKWNAVVSRMQGGKRIVRPLAALSSPELAKANAENWTKSNS